MSEAQLPDYFACVGPAEGERAQRLCMELMHVLKAHYDKGPVGRERVGEALNALAMCAAIQIAGPGIAEENNEFLGEIFKASLNANLKLHYEAQIGAQLGHEEAN